MIDFFADYGLQMMELIFEHLLLSLVSLGLGILFAVPLGILLTRAGKFATFFIGVASILQTIPSLALLALMIPIPIIGGIGWRPAVSALFIYSLLPILRNTYTGMVNVDSTLVDAARGMGMTEKQLILKVELPQAAPVIMAGIRLSGTYVIAWATLASFIGAGGLGDFIFNGLNLYIPELIIGGTIPVAILALLVDFLLGLLEKKVSPRNMQTEQ